MTIIILVVLILISGFLSACEMAFLSIDQLRLKEKVKLGHKKSIKINDLVENTDKLLATIQIAITTIGFLISAYTAETFADDIVFALNITTISSDIVKTVVVILLTVVITYFTMVFGILLPKRIALENPEKLSYQTIDFYIVLMYMLYPFSWLLSKNVDIIVKIFGMNKREKTKITESDVKKIIMMGSKDGSLKPIEEEFMLNIIKFNNVRIEEVMTSKNEMCSLNIDNTVNEIMQVIRDKKFTRYPVYKDNVDNIIGILNEKDIINLLLNTEYTDIKSLLREVVYVNSNEKIVNVFKIMQDNSIGMCIVKNNENSIVGLVTVEDTLEEIVGNIYDEYGT